MSAAGRGTFARMPGVSGIPRLVPPDGPLSLAAHLDRYGPVPYRGRLRSLARRGSAGLLIDTVERSGLTGRGGAGFPAGRKMRAVATRHGHRTWLPGGVAGAVVVANGVESEPASVKDRALLSRSPHLVLDGIELAAEAVDATEAYLCVAAERQGMIRRLRHAVRERHAARLSRVPIEVTAVAGAYVASEETALIRYLNGGPALPAFTPPRPFERGVRGRPTLVHNVETLAHVALIARYGADWFASVGVPEAPGSALVTVSGAVRRPGVYEIALGTPLSALLTLAGGVLEPAQAVLAGGCFGGWLPLPDAVDVPLTDPTLRRLGAAFGSGILVVLPESACGLAETARMVRFLAAGSAGQCGPCRNGVPALAATVERIVWQRADDGALRWLDRLLPLLERRGACHLPDGAVGLVRSMLDTFRADLYRHARFGPCAGIRHSPVVPLPSEPGPRRPAPYAPDRADTGEPAAWAGAGVGSSWSPAGDRR